MKKTVYIESASTDPAFNLALEEYVFEYMSKEKDYFWLWQNKNAIIVGKYQNTAQEINTEYVKNNDIKVVRRLSGGGAVYHDMGNVNFTFISDTGNMEKLNFSVFCQPVVETLKKIGVHSDVSGRNDISIDGKKFSGNAQYVKNGRIMHHGTLMFDSELSVVAKALNADSSKYASKGFKSVRSRVTNIKPYVKKDMSIEQFKRILKEHMVHSNDIDVYHLDEHDIECINVIKRKRYDTWQWNYGMSPKYDVVKSKRIEGVGKLEIHMAVEQGKIIDYESFGDYFGNGATPELKNAISGCSLQAESLSQRLKGFDIEKNYSNLKIEEFIDLLLM